MFLFSDIDQGSLIPILDENFSNMIIHRDSNRIKHCWQFKPHSYLKIRITNMFRLSVCNLRLSLKDFNTYFNSGIWHKSFVLKYCEQTWKLLFSLHGKSFRGHVQIWHWWHRWSMGEAPVRCFIGAKYLPYL